MNGFEEFSAQEIDSVVEGMDSVHASKTFLRHRKPVCLVISKGSESSEQLVKSVK